MRTIYNNLGDIAEFAPGTGSFTLQGVAPPPLIAAVRIASLIIDDGATIGYLAVDAMDQEIYEIGTGTFTLSTGVLTRSPQFGSLADFLGNVNIYIVLLAEDITTNKHVSSAWIVGSLGGVDFTLPFTPGLDSDGLPDVQLYLQGLRLSPNDYSISGTSVTMNYAPIEGPFICSGYKA